MPAALAWLAFPDRHVPVLPLQPLLVFLLPKAVLPAELAVRVLPLAGPRPPRTASPPTLPAALAWLAFPDRHVPVLPLQPLLVFLLPKAVLQAELAVRVLPLAGPRPPRTASPPTLPAALAWLAFPLRQVPAANEMASSGAQASGYQSSFLSSCHVLPPSSLLRKSAPVP